MVLLFDNKNNLTGDELEVGGKSYLMKLKDGTYFNVGKLIDRYKSHFYFDKEYTNHNNIFIFERMPVNRNLVPNMSSIRIEKIFREVKYNLNINQGKIFVGHNRYQKLIFRLRKCVSS